MSYNQNKHIMLLPRRTLQAATAAAFQHAALPLASQLLFSSTSAVWSQSGSAHYAAANAYLDAHAAASQACGLPSTAVQFGPFAGAGMAASHVDGLAALGLNSLQPSQVRLEGQLIPSHAACGCSLTDNMTPATFLPSLNCPQVAQAHLAAGAASQLVYARINAPRFAQIYSAKGRWGLLDYLLLTAEPHPDASRTAAATLTGLGQPVLPAAAPGRSATPAAIGSYGSQPAAGMSLVQVQEAVQTAVGNILGHDTTGESDTRHPSFL